MTNFASVSPLKILEKSSPEGLGRGNLGVLIARAGVGKTACLIHIALDRIFRSGKLVHVSLEEGPEKVTSYYNVIYHDVAEALDIPNEDEYQALIDRNRMILAYLNRSFDLERLRANLNNLADRLEFSPETLIVDGLDFENTGIDQFKGLKKIAEDFSLEIWFSALSHRHIKDVNERGIPYPVNSVDEIFSIIFHLHPEPSGLFLKVLKDHDKILDGGRSVRLDPNTILPLDEP
ncbi:MAG TPA: hypothetical protein HPP59_07800 [Deltaproteobacteria bacterium]|nr:hypothetical protein [Deltaproteobacteria bacterium]